MVRWSLSPALSVSPEAARTSFTAASAIVDKFVLAQADDAQALSLLGQIDAALGRKEEALRESRRARELVPLPKDALQGARINSELTIVYAWIGEKDLALAQPGDLSANARRRLLRRTE